MTSVAPAALASRISFVSRGGYIRSSTSRSGGSSSAGIGDCCRRRDSAERVDQDLGLGQLRLDHRLVPRHRAQLHVRRAAAEVADQALGAVEVAVEDDDALEAGGDEAVDRGAGAAAGADDHRLRGIFWRADERVERRRGNRRRRCCGRPAVVDSRVIVSTAPVAWASSVSRSIIGTTRSLYGTVMFAPR